LSPKLRRICKTALSVFVCWHLLCVFILPNPNSVLYNELRSWVVKYGTFLGVQTTWIFFSPRPMMSSLEYDVFYDGTEKLESETFRYPRPIEEEGFREVYNRKLNNAVFFSNQPEQFSQIYAPILCKIHPHAKEISVYVRHREMSEMEKSRIIGRTNITELGKVQRQAITDIDCRESENHDE
jgi:hypothetical protein